MSYDAASQLRGLNELGYDSSGPGGGALAQITDSGAVHYYHPDRGGSTRLLTDAAGAQAASYSYDPYGRVRSQTGTVENPIGYRGAYTDPESGLQPGGRYYDPQTAQNLTRGPHQWDPGQTSTPGAAASPTGPQPKPPPRVDPPTAIPDEVLDAEEALADAEAKLAAAADDSCKLACTIKDAVIGDPTRDPLDALALLPPVKGLKLAGAAGKLFTRAGGKVGNIGAARRAVDAASGAVAAARRRATKAGGGKQIGPAGNPGAVVSHDHHVFPQQFKRFFDQRGIDIDQFTVSLGAGRHLRGIHGRGGDGLPGHWNARWRDFIGNNPNASTKDVYQFGGRLMDEYGLSGMPIRRYGGG